MKPLEILTRKNIWNLAPYSSARNEYAGREAHVFLDANENPYNTPYNRYPDPLQLELKAAISKVKGVPADNIFLGNGSDEAIDLPYRCFCEPSIDNVVAIEPTYGMYRVCADINGVEYRPVLLDENYQITADKLLAATDEHTKIIWLCSPNNPTGNNLQREEIVKVIETFEGIVIVDEAYSDFSSQKPLRTELAKYPNLIVLNTMSKAWGCAAIRLGMAFASEQIIAIFNKVKYPYNVNLLTQQQALEALKDPFEVDKWVKLLLEERSRMIDAFKDFSLFRFYRYQAYPVKARIASVFIIVLHCFISMPNRSYDVTGTGKCREQVSIGFHIRIISHAEHDQRKLCPLSNGNIFIVVRIIHLITDFPDMIRLHNGSLLCIRKDRGPLLSFYIFLCNRIVHAHRDLPISFAISQYFFTAGINNGITRSTYCILSDYVFLRREFHFFRHIPSSSLVALRITIQFVL